jgi:hypothetical protein
MVKNYRKARFGEKNAMVQLMMVIDTDWCLLWPLSHSDIICERVCVAANGEKPTFSHEVAHSCNNGKCINRHHLRWATRAENMADRKLGRNIWTMKIELK